MVSYGPNELKFVSPFLSENKTQASAWFDPQVGEQDYGPVSSIIKLQNNMGCYPHLVDYGRLCSYGALGRPLACVDPCAFSVAFLSRACRPHSCGESRGALRPWCSKK